MFILQIFTVLYTLTLHGCAIYFPAEFFQNIFGRAQIIYILQQKTDLVFPILYS